MEQQDNFSPEETEFQNALIESNFELLQVHECLARIDELLEKFIRLKEIHGKNVEKRYGLLVQLQLLKAKNLFLLERCEHDNAALERFFFLHEKISSIHERLSNSNQSNEEEKDEQIDGEIKISEEEEQQIGEEEESSEEEIDGIFECPICYMEVDYSETKKYDLCQHRFCKEVNISLHFFLCTEFKIFYLFSV